MRRLIIITTLLLCPTLVFADITTGLVDWWKLDEGTGTTASDSGSNAVTMNLKNTPTWIAAKVNSGVQFNGSSNNLQSNAAVNLSTTNVITIAFWMYQNAFDNNDELAMEFSANYNSTNGGILLDPNSGGGLSGCSAGSFDIATSDGTGTNGHYNLYNLTRPSAAAWHHYVLIIYKSNVNSNLAYVDGVSTSLTHCQTNALSGNFANTTLNFMARNNASLFNAGKMDEIRIYNRALSAADAAQLYAYPPAIVQGGSIIQGGSQIN